MFKNFNRDISTFTAIGIIAILVVVVGGGILAYQYYSSSNQNVNSPALKDIKKPMPVSPTPSTSVPTAPIPVIESIYGVEERDIVIIGDTIEVKVKNFSGFEGDINLWIENGKGEKGIIYGEEGSNNDLIKFKLKSEYCQSDVSYSGLPCPAFLNINPGVYKIYVMPWGIKSNISYLLYWPPDTLEWKKYKNDEYGFEFEYPINATNVLKEPRNSKCYFETELPCEDLMDGFSFEYPFTYLGGSGIELSVINRQLDKSFIDMYNGMWGGQYPEELISIGGKEGYKYDFVAAANYKIFLLLIPINNDHFLEVTENTKFPMMETKDWDRIISTFKFTK